MSLQYLRSALSKRTGAAYVRRCLAGAACFAVALSALGQTIDRPAVSAGDTWTYRDTKEVPPSGWSQTRDDVIVSRVTGSSIYFTTKESGSNQTGRERFSTREWGVLRDLTGTETLTNQPLAFPLAPGKTWQVEYTEQHPTKAHNWEKWTRHYTAVGYEPIEVPAGKFTAMKIEVEGRWIAELAPAQAIVQTARSTESGATMATQVNKVSQQTASGRIYAVYWYAPEVKRFVKTVEETYDNKGSLSDRVTGELESFKLAK